MLPVSVCDQDSENEPGAESFSSTAQHLVPGSSDPSAASRRDPRQTSTGRLLQDPIEAT